MRIQRSIRYLLIALGLLCCSQLAACGSQGILSSQGGDIRAPIASPSPSLSHSTTDYAVPPVILHDPAPHELEVVFNVINDFTPLGSPS